MRSRRRNPDDDDDLTAGYQPPLEFLEALKEGVFAISPGWMAYPDGRVSRIAVSPDGETIVTGGYERVSPTTFKYSARLWKNTGELLQVFERTGTISGVDFDPTGKYVGIASHDRSVAVYNLAGDSIFHRNFSNWVIGIAFHPYGNAGIVMLDSNVGYVKQSSPNPLRFFDFVTGAEIPLPDVTKDDMLLKGMNTPVKAVAFSPDGRWLAASFLTYFKPQTNTFIWDLKTGDRSDCLGMGTTTFLKFSPYEKILGVDNPLKGQIQLWQLSESAQVTKVKEYPYLEEYPLLETHPVVVGFAFHPNRRWLITVAEQEIRMVDIRTGATQRTIDMPTPNGEAATCCSLGGNLLAVGFNNGSLQTFSVD